MDDEDECLLSGLGVTTARPEDIERDVIAAVQQNDRGFHDQAGTHEAEAEENTEDGDDISLRLRNHLAALDQEIDAVAACLDPLQHRRADAINVEDSDGEGGDVAEGSKLQKALVEERLASLREKQAAISEKLSLVQTASVKYAPRANANDEARECDSKGGDTRLKQNTLVILDDDDFDAAIESTSGFVETERDRLIRTGVVTPFDRLKGFERRVERVPSTNVQDRAEITIANAVASIASHERSRPTVKLLDPSEIPKLAPPTRAFHRLRRIQTPFVSKDAQVQSKKHKKRKRPMPEEKWRKRIRSSYSGEEVTEEEVLSGFSSGSEDDQESMLARKPRKKESVFVDIKETDTDILLEGGLRVPSQIYDKLFDYQKTGVKWLWELHCQRAGGIIADEMGLGKTIQIISFLAALHHSGLYTPSIVVCPMTLLRQWKREVHKWYGFFQVEILHDSAISYLRKFSKSRPNDDGMSDEEERNENDEEKSTAIRRAKRKGAVIEQIVANKSGLLLTTYEQLRSSREKLLDVEWGYAVLDEGHRIRNPDAEITLVCKQLRTVHRIIITGAPIQNKLVELWSLFDFVFPGKLGVLPIFQAQFALPIAIGGYANATPLQVTTAYKCAVVLRDLILPYMLRRLKSDVNAQLPKKTEQVLFCSLSEEQRSTYRAFLGSSEVEQIFDGNRNALYGIDILRKICNHPDLLEREHSGSHPDYGNPERSGKLKVVAQVLELWKSQGSRVLIFSQTQQMLDIIENFLVSKEYAYRRMDGSTPGRQRMALIDEFNESSHVFVFILTTKVGGLGTNLIGANKVIIFDPDWNPSTDIQARERAWRIGQTRDVTIYRLITRGTIEEKVYHRQIYKHFLTNKILKDPQQKRFFKAKDMRDLFTLNEDKHETRTETSTLFSELGDVKLGSRDEPSSSSVNNLKLGKVTRRAVKDEDRESIKESTSSQDGESNEDDSQILKCLFEANGIHSALNHNAIESMNEVEKMKVDSESARVAQQAVDAVMQSRMLRSSDSVAVPTWTGRSGSAGAPAAVRRRFGSTTNSQFVMSLGSAVQQRTDSSRGVSDSPPNVVAGLGSSCPGRALSSMDVLARLREGHCVFGANAARPHTNSIASRHVDENRVDRNIREHQTLTQQVRAFIERNGGSVTSACLIENFKDIVPPGGASVFRQLLKEIALLKNEGTEARWILRNMVSSDNIATF